MTRAKSVDTRPAPRISKSVTYTVAPSLTPHTHELAVKIDKRPLITVQSLDSELLERLGYIIAHNKMPYNLAQQLCAVVSSGRIPQGQLANHYLYPKLAYRVVHSYRNDNGAVCGHYFTFDEAYNSPAIQREIAEATEKYNTNCNYDDVLSVVNQGKPWTVLHYTILHSRISRAGSIRGYVVPPQRDLP